MPFFDPQKAMRNITREGMAASAMFAVTNAFLTVFAAALGASNTEIGLLVAAPAAIALISYLPAAYAIEAWNRRRLTCTLMSLVSRSMWFLAGAIPFLIMWNILQGAGQSVMLLIMVVSAYSLFSAFVAPAWASMVGVIIPENVRGSYFGRRNQLCAIASLTTGTLAGLVLQAFDSVLGFSLIFAAAGVAGIVSSFFFSGFPDIRFRPERVLMLSELRAAFRNRAFISFMAVLMLWEFGVSMSAPFMNVYLVRGLGAGYAWISVLVLAAGASTIIIQKWWGAVSDIFGHRSILVISAFGVAFVPFLWMIAPSPEFTVIINIISGASWAGFNLASFNYLLGASGGGKRTIYTAVYWTLIGIPIIIAPLVGGALTDMLMPLSYPISGFRGMFFISWIVRMAAVGLFACLLPEMPAKGERVSTMHVAREVITLGFHSLRIHHFHLLGSRRLGYTRWVAMNMLSRIKGGIGRKRG